MRRRPIAHAPTRRAALDPDAYATLRAAVLARDGYRCTNPACGRPKDLQVHHLVARSQGGPDGAGGNLTTVCQSCHRALEDGRLSVRIVAMHPDRAELAWTDHRPRQTGW
jgi:hypothetical protein